MQRVREAEDAAQPRPQLALQNAPHGSPAASFLNSPKGLPSVRGPDGLATQMVATSRSEPGTTESFVISTPRASPPQPLTGRSISSLPWRSTSCSRRRQESCQSTPPSTTDVVASTDPFKHRFTFGGNEPRPGPDVPQLPLDVVKGYVVVDERKGFASTKDRGAASARDAILDTRDESLRHKREALKMER